MWRAVVRLLDVGVVHLGRVVGIVRDAHVLLHRPRPHLVMKCNDQRLVAGDAEPLADHRIALGLVRFNTHGVDQFIEPRIAYAREIEVAIRAFGARANKRLQCVLRIIGGHPPAQEVRA